VIRLQIVERPGADLFAALKEAMRTKELRTFILQKRGKRVVHARYPGWIAWSAGEGVIDCEIRSPYQPDAEWQILGAFVGRLAHKYADRVQSLQIWLQPPAPKKRPTRTKKK
jgi:hypothetical protein